MIFKANKDGSLTNIFKELKSVQVTFEDLDKSTLRSVIKAFNSTSMSVDDLSTKFGRLLIQTQIKQYRKHLNEWGLVMQVITGMACMMLIPN